MLVIGGKDLTLNEVSQIVFDKIPVELADTTVSNLSANHSFLRRFSDHKLIYGINTGFGPMAQFKVSAENALQLQYNLIRSHSSGAGKVFDPLLGRAVMVARLNSLLQGYSGVHPELVELLVTLINKDIVPCIYEHGGVGASGDLVQLAHLGLVLIGEGEVLFAGRQRSTAEVFAEQGVRPLSIHIREGLAIINGTSAMTGVGLVNLVLAKKLLHWSVLLSAMTNELVSAYDDHYSYELNIVKKHRGQNRIAELMRGMLAGSGMIRSRSEHLYVPENIQQEVFSDKVQEYYSLRCVTQVLGPVYDTIVSATRTVVDELNSVNDNPVVDHANENIFHGGNFHGDYVSLEMDKLKIAITKLSMLSERQLNYLLNDKLNQKFPPFMNLGVLGLNFGMQGVQFTATSTVAENQTLSFPMYVHSIPNNNDNQDIVSMGCNAALMTRRVIENSFEVLSIQLMTVLQGVDYLDCEDRLSPVTAAAYREMREIFPKFIEDAPRYQDVARLREHLKATEPGWAVQETINENQNYI